MGTLANALNAIKVAETKGKPATTVRPASKEVRALLEILKTEGYIESFEHTTNIPGGEFNIALNGKINGANVIRPRFPVKNADIEKYESRFLPAKGVGLLVISTSKGMMTHAKAKELKIGGRLMAFVY
ncbi:MAG: 30S ribosomal protein S8 [Candidatus Micrarchaeota archaeon]